MKLIGLVVTRSHLTLDYTPIQAAISLAPVCDTVFVSDMESDDGSYEDLQKKLGGLHNIIVETQPWDKPHNDPQWWVRALNHARKKFVSRGEMFIQLDADEVIGPESHGAIREAANSNPLGGAMFKRYTFWGDANHLVPHNRCCGEMVARMGPGHMYLPSDEPIPAERPNIREVAEEYPNLYIYHYGMIREPSKFLAKSDVVQNAFFGSVDQRLKDVKDGEPWYKQRDYFDGLPLRDFTGKHPAIMHEWLKERGHL